MKREVLDAGLCTGCGACVGLCPYQVVYHDRTVQLHHCDLIDGKCRDFCPRSEIDLRSLRALLFDANDLTPEIGAVKGYYLARAADPELRNVAQHGGTVTALMELAMVKGMIDTAIVSSGRHGFDLDSANVKNVADLRAKSGSKFLVTPTVAAFHRVAAESSGDIGVVATPCQALALAKIRAAASKDEAGKTGKLKMVIGLYCGWTLSLPKFRELLFKSNIAPESLTGMDIPAGGDALEIDTIGGTRLIPLAEVRPCIREACSYCFDSTAEYADISAGAARFGGTREEMRGWNQVIVRTDLGRDLMEIAVKSGILEIREAPAEVLKDLKNAAAEKKKAALKNIIGKSGSAKKLLYLSSFDPVVRKFLKKINR